MSTNYNEPDDEPADATNLSQLDRQLAVLLGYRPINVLHDTRPNREPDFWAPPGDSVEATRNPPEFSTTWGGAGLVVEAMREQGHFLILAHLATSNEWRAQFSAPRGGIRVGIADTAPLAICRAAIAALGAQS